MSNYHTTSKDSKSYSEGYEIFLKRTNFREMVLNHFINSFPKNLQRIKNLSILDLGCGNGEMTALYLEAINKLNPEAELEVYLLEPAAQVLNLAKERALKYSNKIIAINESADFCAKESNLPKFNLIIASYVFYHIDPNLIPNLSNNLNENGSIAIMMGSKTHPLREHPALRQVSKHGDSDVLKEPLELVASKGLCIQRSKIETNVNLNGLWSKESAFSEDGEKYISFIYNTNFSDFPVSSSNALAKIMESVFSKNDGIIHPIHEFIWVTRL
jgi:SAM-dependent methyltransferase